MHEAEAAILRDQIRSMRVQAGLRQEDVAIRLGLPQSYVSKCESGERRIDVIELDAFCRACKCDLGTFVERLALAIDSVRE